MSATPTPSPGLPDVASAGAAGRLAAVRAQAAAAGVDALLVTPGPDLRWLIGYQALPLERLTALVVPTEGDPFLLVPQLERPAAAASGAGDLVDLVPWAETEDPFARVAGRLGVGLGAHTGPRVVAVSDLTRASHVLALQAAMPGSRWVPGSQVVGPLRRLKGPDEVAELRRAGAAIDRVHARMGEWLRVGRTEREVGRDIADAILAEGHAEVAFVIVAAGPNGASPHHEVSDRPIGRGEPVVVDIGGVLDTGYASDCTRMYSVGAPDDTALAVHALLQQAQDAGVAAVRPGVTAQDVDNAARSVITAGGYGEAFVHRTGHGIGLEVHEEPWIVAGNTMPLEPGMCFSVEPGIYLPGRYGFRIEDIVTVTADGVERLDLVTRDLVVLDA